MSRYDRIRATLQIHVRHRSAHDTGAAFAFDDGMLPRLSGVSIARTDLAYYTAEVRHAGLGVLEQQSGLDRDVLERWGEHRCRQLDADFRVYREERARQQRELAEAQYRASREAEAATRTLAAEAARRELLLSLRRAAESNEADTWAKLRRADSFSEPAPPCPPPPKAPREPRIDDASMAVEPTLGERLAALFFPPKPGSVSRRTQERWRRSWERWKSESARTLAIHAAAQAQWQQDLALWNARRANFLAERDAYNRIVDELCTAWIRRESWAIEQYAEWILLLSQYSIEFSRSIRVGLDSVQGELVVEYALPAPTDLPVVARVAYEPTTDELVEHLLSEGEIQSLWEAFVRQVALRSMHELFESDSHRAFRTIVFSASATVIDPGTGKPLQVLVLSVRATRDAILALDLACLDPAVCLSRLEARVALKGGLDGVQPLRSIPAVPER